MRSSQILHACALRYKSISDHMIPFLVTLYRAASLVMVPEVKIVKRGRICLILHAGNKGPRNGH